MSFQELINQRQSVRRYRSKLVEREKLEQLIKAVHIAPSACNSQPWKLIIVDEPNLKNEVAEATISKAISFNKFALEAPVIVAIVCGKSKAYARFAGAVKRKNYGLIDIGITAEHFCLAAAEDGVGTCML